MGKEWKLAGQWTERDCQRAISLSSIGTIVTTKDKALEMGAYWLKLTIYGVFTGKEGEIFCAVAETEDGIPDKILWKGKHSDGTVWLEAVKEKDWGLTDYLGNAWNDIRKGVKGLLAATAIINPEAFIALQGKVKRFETLIPENLHNILSSLQDNYFRATAWIKETIHLDTVKTLSDIAELTIPAYHQYMIDIENDLADLSNKIFGNTNSIQNYIYMVELSYYQMARQAGEENDIARRKSLENSAKLANGIRKNLQDYKRNPALVWQYIYSESFGDNNPYIKSSNKVQDKEVLETLKNASDKVKEIDSYLSNLGMYEPVIKELGITGMNKTLKLLTESWQEFYDTDMKITIKMIDTKFKEQEEKRILIEKKLEKEQQAKDRAIMITSNPALLTEEQQKEQESYLQDIIDKYVMPETKINTNIFTDIDKTLNGIFDKD